MVINSLRATARSIIDRRIRSRMCQHHLCALAICSLLFIPPPSTALALSGNSEPAIAANQNGQEIFNVEICRMVGPINPDFEEQMEDQKLMKRLAQPHHKNGVTFDWQLGEGSGVTYWSRKEQKPAVSVLPSKVHHLITLYFPDPDKLVSWTATAIRVSRFDQLVPDVPWFRDLGLILLDHTTHKTLVVSYWSHVAGRLEDFPSNVKRNARYDALRTGTTSCSN